MAGSCYFIGHADTPEDVLARLREEVEKHIAHGVTDFYVGQYGRFDALAAQALREAKALHPGIRIMLVLPYHPAERPARTPEGFDGAFYPFERAVPHRYAIARANRAMIDGCDCLIACVRHPGRSRDFLEYALRREAKGLIRTVNIAGDAIAGDAIAGDAAPCGTPVKVDIS